MKILKELLEVCISRTSNGLKCPVIKSIKEDYEKDWGIVRTRTCVYYGSINELSGIKIADAYEDLEHIPNDALTKAAYEQLAKEVTQQFNYLNNKEKITYEPFEGEGEPYKNSFEMLKDFHNHHLYFFKTESGFGETEYTYENKMLEKTGIVYNNYELLVNDVFRIIHDIFGHAMNGYGFGPIGEDKAWFAHMQMFTPLAAAALTTETRGQNCWVNFGPHMRDKNGKLKRKDNPDFILPQNRPFADQKMNLLPSFVSGIDVREVNGKVCAKFIPLWDPLLFNQ